MSNRPRTRSATRNEQLRDRLSDLPMGIIQDILCRIPVRNAVRMCVLSSEWKDTWTTLPFLDFNSHGDEPMEEFDRSTKNIITEVLSRHKGPIHVFRLSYPNTVRIGSVENWLLLLALNKVKYLHLDVKFGSDGSLKSNVYKCLKLTDLSVWNFKMCPPPSGFKGFKFLTSIVLAGVELSTTGLESLVSHCQVLMYLSILICPIVELTINSPNLKYLSIRGYHSKLSWYAPHLDEIYVALLDGSDLQDNQSTRCNYTNLLGRCTNLKELGGADLFTQYLNVGLESSHNTLVFHRLKAIQLRGMTVTDASSTAVVARLIKDAPNLEKIEISINYGHGAPDVSFRDHFKFLPSFTLKKLKDVKLICLWECPIIVQIAKFLLEASPVLETMEIEIPISLVNEVSAVLDKAAPNAKVTFVTYSE